MFSLIIAIISIALVVALVAASGYFGGDAISSAKATIEATRLSSEEVQIMTSMDMFYAGQNKWPASVDELVTSGHLRSVPSGVLPAKEPTANIALLSLPSAYAESGVSGGWSMPTANLPVIYTAMHVPKAVCQAYNLAKRGDDGILRQPFEVLPSQCYGAEGSYQVVVRKAGSTATLASALPKPVIIGNLPGKAEETFWDVIPSGDVLNQGKTPEPVFGLAFDGLAESSGSDSGRVQVGETLRSGLVTLNNSGNSAASGVVIQAPDGFRVVQGTCGSTLAPGANCVFQFDFSPVAPQAYSGPLTVKSSNGAEAQRTLTGAGVNAAGFIEPTNFGDVAAGTVVELAVMVSNQGIGPLTLGTPRINGAQSFSVVPGGTCALTLTAGSTCTVNVALTSQGSTNSVGELIFPTTEAGELRAALQGKSYIAPQLTVTTKSLDFGSLLTMRQSPWQSVTVTNTGGNPLIVKVPTYDNANFTVDDSKSTCWINKPVAAGNSCIVYISFTPRKGGSIDEQLPITSNGGDTEIRLTGIGVEPVVLKGANLEIQGLPVDVATGLPLYDMGVFKTYTTVTARISLKNTGDDSTDDRDATGFGEFSDSANIWLEDTKSCHHLAPGDTCTLIFESRIFDAASWWASLSYTYQSLTVEGTKTLKFYFKGVALE